MSETASYKQLTYQQQLEKTNEMAGKLIGLPVVSLDQYRRILDLQATLKDRIEKQKKGEV